MKPTTFNVFLASIAILLSSFSGMGCGIFHHYFHQHMDEEKYTAMGDGLRKFGKENIHRLAMGLEMDTKGRFILGIKKLYVDRNGNGLFSIVYRFQPSRHQWYVFKCDDRFWVATKDKTLNTQTFDAQCQPCRMANRRFPMEDVRLKFIEGYEVEEGAWRPFEP